MRKNIFGKYKGFTLLELLIATALSFIALLAILAVVNQILIRSKGSWEAYKAYSSGQAVMDRMSKELREATALLLASDQSVSFKEYLNATDTVPHQIRFFLDGTTLKKGDIPPSGVSPNYTYNPSNETIKVLAFDIANGTDKVFSYYNQNGVALSTPANPVEVTLINMKLVIRQVNNPQPFTVETSVQLRFNKNNL